MREYEILYIIKPHLSEEDYTKIIHTFEGWITQNGGEILLSNVMGLKELATVLDKQTHGYYVQCQFRSGNEALDEIATRLGVSETIFRHLLVTLDSIQPKPGSEAKKKPRKSDTTPVEAEKKEG